MYATVFQSEPVADAETHIFLASRRQGVHSDYARHFQTLPAGNQGIGTLQKLSDDTLRAGISLLVEAETDSTIVLIPYIGDVHLVDASGDMQVREEGQVYAWTVQQGETYELRNPCPNDDVNFFQLVFAGHPRQLVQTQPIIMDERPNELRPICQGENTLLIGKYDGRAEGTYRMQKSARCVFVFVIEGAFEVQNRLLQPRDGLVLWNVDEVQFEALSQDAVLLVVEL